MAEKNPFARFLTHYKRGHVLFKEGDDGDEMFIVQSARVVVQVGVQQAPLAVVVEREQLLRDLAAALEIEPQAQALIDQTDGFGDRRGLLSNVTLLHVQLGYAQLFEQRVVEHQYQLVRACGLHRGIDADVGIRACCVVAHETDSETGITCCCSAKRVAEPNTTSSIACW